MPVTWQVAGACEASGVFPDQQAEGSGFPLRLFRKIRGHLPSFPSSPFPSPLLPLEPKTSYARVPMGKGIPLDAGHTPIPTSRGRDGQTSVLPGLQATLPRHFPRPTLEAHNKGNSQMPHTVLCPNDTGKDTFSLSFSPLL